MKEATKYHIAFSHFLGIGPVIFRKLVDHFGDVKSAYLAKNNHLKKVLGLKLAEKFIEFRKKFKTDSIEDTLFKKNIQVLTCADKEYPKSLAHISDPPICLYIRGNAKIFAENDLFFSIVGTRRVTSYGEQIAQEFASQLAQYGFVIVSGMAIGIDAVAHWATINASGKTVAVLGCGVDVIYPQDNSKLYHTIAQTGGAVISEFAPGMFVLPGLFVARNRIVSGLSRGVLVVEGTEKSGTLITARFAAEQGRDVFAPPSPITSYSSRAPNLLLKQGAKLVTSVDDILEEYDIKITKKDKKNLLEGLHGLDRQVMEILVNESLMADELCLKLKKPISEILNSLSLLELSGFIKKDDQGKYFKR